MRECEVKEVLKSPSPSTKSDAMLRGMAPAGWSIGDFRINLF